MQRRAIYAIGVALSFIVMFSVVRVVQENNVGVGPVKTAPAPDGRSREIAFVANGIGGTVTLIDIGSKTAVGEIDVLPDGDRVGFFRDPVTSLFWQPFIESRAGLNYAQDTDVSPDGTVLYVARAHLGDIAAFDIATGDLMWRVRIPGARSDHMAISPDGSKLFVAALTENKVIVIDTATARKVGSFMSGAWPHDNHVTKDGKYIYNASLGDMTKEVDVRDNVKKATNRKGYAYQITLADAETFEVIDRYRFDAGIRPFAVTSDRKTIFAQLSNTHAVVRHDIDRREVVDRVDLPVSEGVTEDDWDFEAPHHGLALSSDERTLCIAGRASDYAAIVAADGFEILGVVPVGDAPSWAVIDKSGEYCILANTRSDDVSIVSLTEKQEVARIKAGDYAKHITLADVPEKVLAVMKPGDPK
ncbi:MAG: serine/threonine protein kinase [Pseudomonadota bacterium]